MKKIIYVGLDVHKENVSMAAFLDGEKSPFWEKTVANENNKILKEMKKLKKDGKIKSCYEAGCTGLNLHRFLVKNEIDNIIVSPGKLPRYSGDKIKNDRKDARKIGDLLRQGVLESIYIPTLEDESVKALIRLREDVRIDQLRWRQKLKSFLLLNNIKSEHSASGWTGKYRKWLDGLTFDDVHKGYVFSEYLQQVKNIEANLKELDARIVEISQSDKYQKKVNKLRCLKGIDYLTALTFVVEIGDFERFPTAQAFMSFLGIVPGEYSSGSKRHQTGITKTGNTHLRRLITESAWHYRYPYQRSKRIDERRRGQEPNIIAYAEKCSKRLAKKYVKMTSRNKAKQITITALGRELSGFMWGLMVDKIA